MKNRALFGRKYLDIQIRDMELPAPGPTQALIEIKACGVCGTDLNFIRDWEEDYMPLGKTCRRRNPRPLAAAPRGRRTF